MRCIVLLLVACSLLPLTASAQGEGAFGVAPTDVPFGTAIRGEPLHRLISLQNGKAQPVEIELKPGDETGAWALSTERNLTLPPHSTTDVALEMLVPQDVPNGHYNGSIYVHFLPEANVTTGTSGAKLAFAIRVNLSVEIGGPQVLRLDAGGLFVPDTEESTNPIFYWTLQNDGNVRAQPIVTVNIRRPDGQMILVDNVTGPVLAPGLKNNATFRINATLATGQYILTATLASNDSGASHEEAWFNSLEAGSLRRTGTLNGLGLYDIGTGTETHRIPFGNTVELRGNFSNTGQTAIKAKLQGYVAQEGNLILNFTSTEVTIDPGETSTLKVLLGNLPRGGQYSVSAEVAYSGKITPSREAILILEQPPAAKGIPFGGIATSLIIVIACAMTSKRRN